MAYDLKSAKGNMTAQASSLTVIALTSGLKAILDGMGPWLYVQTSDNIAYDVNARAIGSFTFTTTTLAATAAGQPLLINVNADGKYYAGKVVDDGTNTAVMIDNEQVILPGGTAATQLVSGEGQTYPSVPKKKYTRIGIASDGSVQLGETTAEFHGAAPVALDTIAISAQAFVQVGNSPFAPIVYQSGTVATTAGSATVTGTSTAFLAAWRGGRITITTTTRSDKYTVVSRASATSLTITPVAAATVTGAIFGIETLDAKWQVATI